ncbi:MAG: universal stress protein [Solirubrobacteraceae bacterium]
MTAAAPTAPPPAATPDAALPIQRRSGTLLVGVEGWPGSLAAVGWAARHARRLIVATAPPPLPGLTERDAGLLRGDQRRVARHLMGLAGDDPALEACAWLPAIADGSSPAEALIQCARMHACEAIVIGSPDGDHDVCDELLRIADVPVIVVPSPGHPAEDRS